MRAGTACAFMPPPRSARPAAAAARWSPVTPDPGCCASSRRARPSNSVVSRARMFASPTPGPELSASPRPVSATCTRSRPSLARAVMRTSPPCGSGLSPWRIAFSTSVTSIIGGNGTPASDSGTSMRTASRGPMRIAAPRDRPWPTQLVLERGHRRAHARQHRAQVPHEVLEHRARGRGIGAEQPPHVRERVEQEMRLDLRLHHLQPRLRELAVEIDAPQLLVMQPRGGILLAQHEEVAEYCRRRSRGSTGSPSRTPGGGSAACPRWASTASPRRPRSR